MNSITKVLDEDIVRRIERGIDPGDGTVESRHLGAIGGTKNVGAIEHTHLNSGRTFLTKIVPSELVGNEILFYHVVRREFPALATFTPEPIPTFVEVGGLCFITVERIVKGKGGSFTLERLNHLLELRRRIASVCYQEIAPVFAIGHLCRPLPPFISLFSKIHLRQSNDRLLTSLHNRVKEAGHNDKVLRCVKYMKSVFLDRRIYDLIEPESHYVLLHGDFAGVNVVRDIHEKYYVIDWSACSVGPKGADLARLFTIGYKMPFPEMKELLFDGDLADDLDAIDQAFFIFALVISWSKNNLNLRLSEGYDRYFLPAIEYLEDVAAEI